MSLFAGVEHTLENVKIDVFTTGFVGQMLNIADLVMVCLQNFFKERARVRVCNQKINVQIDVGSTLEKPEEHVRVQPVPCVAVLADGLHKCFSVQQRLATKTVAMVQKSIVQLHLFFLQINCFVRSVGDFNIKLRFLCLLHFSSLLNRSVDVGIFVKVFVLCRRIFGTNTLL